MKVKIDNTIYDGADVRIMIIMNQGEKQQIADMAPEATKYCQYPESMAPEDIKNWMDEVDG